MARIARVVLPDYPHHIMQRGVQNVSIFEKKEDYARYKEILRTSCDKFGVKIVAYCLTPNHIHLIAIPKKENSLAKAIGETHRQYTKYINFQQNQNRHPFKNRFFSTPLDELHFFIALHYVEKNPVRLKIAKNAWEYEHSSVAFRAKYIRNDTLLSSYQPVDTIDNYIEFLQEKDISVDIIRKKTLTGRPCGDEKFYTLVKNITGRNLLPKKTINLSKKLNKKTKI